jgi:O-acetyl-ADP-ribose deacetylase (regulator of RNase III)
MIHEVEGDILLTKAQAVAHGIGPNEEFDKGLALALREKWPSLSKDYRHYAHQVHPRAGELWMWGGTGGVRIYNLLDRDGSFEHGAKSGRATVANVNHCLRRLRHELQHEKIRSIALPRLATGAGGLDWKDVRPLIETNLGDLAIPVFIYTTYHSGVAAAETGL